MVRCHEWTTYVSSVVVHYEVYSLDDICFVSWVYLWRIFCRFYWGYLCFMYTTQDISFTAIVTFTTECFILPFRLCPIWRDGLYNGSFNNGIPPPLSHVTITDQSVHKIYFKTSECFGYRRPLLCFAVSWFSIIFAYHTFDKFDWPFRIVHIHYSPGHYATLSWPV